MKLRLYLCVLAFVSCGPLAGCATHEGTDAAVGGALGAGTGALIGSATGHTGAGALIGGGVGALTGAVVGHEEDKADHRAAVAAAAQSQGPMTVNDVVYLTQSNVAESTIIRQIQNSRTIFQLSPTDVVNLKAQGVTDNVINAMLDTTRRPVVYRHRPDVVVVDPYPPPPPVGVGVGIGYRIR